MTSYTDTIMADGPTRFYRLGELSGTVAKNRTEQGNDGTYTGGVALGVEGTQGNDKAASFDGSDDYVSITSPMSTLQDNWTLEGWIKPQAASVGALAAHNGDDRGGYGFGQGNGVGNPGGKLQGLLGAVVWIDTGYTFPTLNIWYYIIMQRVAGTTKFFVNTIQTPNASASNPALPQGRSSIGCQINNVNVPHRFWNGDLIGLAFYPFVLSTARILAHYEAGIGYLGLIGQDSDQTFEGLATPPSGTLYSSPITIPLAIEIKVTNLADFLSYLVANEIITFQEAVYLYGLGISITETSIAGGVHTEISRTNLGEGSVSE